MERQKIVERNEIKGAKEKNEKWGQKKRKSHFDENQEHKWAEDINRSCMKMKDGNELKISGKKRNKNDIGNTREKKK